MKQKRGLKERLIEEVKRFGIMFLYLYVLFALFNIHEYIILTQRHIDFTHYGFALINALVLAKVMLVAEDLRVGSRFDGSPLIYPVIFKSLMFAVIFIVFHIIEDTLVGLWHGKTFAESVPSIGGGGLTGVVAVGVIMAFCLIPFFAFAEVSRVIGGDELRNLIFRRGPKDVIVEARLRFTNDGQHLV
jgi:hypothetical protein